MHNHSFVVRIWLEEAATERNCQQWRGHITHYPSLQDRYFDDFGIILTFIRTCLAANGAESGSGSVLG